MHPNGKAHGEITLIIKSDIKHYEIGTKEKVTSLQASIMVKDQNGCTNSAVYSPPKYAIKREHYITFFKTLDNRFIVTIDYNAKYMY